MDYFDNGIICNLIEHVSGCSLTLETSLSGLPENSAPSPGPSSLPFSPFKREKDTSGLGDILKDQVEVTLTLSPWPRVRKASWPCWMKNA